MVTLGIACRTSDYVWTFLISWKYSILLLFRSIYDAMYLSYDDVQPGEIVSAKVLDISSSAGLKVSLGSWQGEFVGCPLISYPPVSSLAKHVGIGAGGLGIDSRAAQIGYSVAIAAMFLRSCVAQAQSCGDGSRLSLHASM